MLTLWACGAGGLDSADALDSADTGTPDPCAETLRTWDNTGAPFLTTWCTSCHGAALLESERQGAPLGVDLNSHEDAVLWADRNRVRALESGDRPPVVDPEAEDLAALAEWLDCGLP